MASKKIMLNNLENIALFRDVLAGKVAPFWFNLGLTLNIDLDILICINIEDTVPTVRSKAAKMIETYMDKAENVPHWEDIRKELRFLGRGRLVSEMESKFNLIKQEEVPMKDLDERNAYGRLIYTLSNEIGVYWKQLGRLLGIADCYLNNIDRDKKFTAHKAMAMLHYFIDTKEEGLGTALKVIKDKLNHMKKCPVALSINKFEDILLEEHPINVVNPEGLKCYPIKYGRCIIFNNEFEDKDFRYATKVDADRVGNVFQWFNFKVNIFTNFSAAAMIAKLKEESSGKDCNGKKYDCITVIVLSHGKNGVVYGNDNKTVAIDEITQIFNGDNCVLLAGQPKLFFIQACQSEDKQKDPKTGISGTSFDSPPNDLIMETDSESLPPDTDQFVYVATTPGKPACRDNLYGSWFIQELCSVFEKHALEISLKSMKNEITSKVSVKSTIVGDKRVNMVPNVVKDTLRKSIYFKPTVKFNDWKTNNYKDANA